LRIFAATYLLTIAAPRSTHRPTRVHMHMAMTIVVLWVA
jgi:hypothetical protein